MKYLVILFAFFAITEKAIAEDKPLGPAPIKTTETSSEFEEGLHNGSIKMNVPVAEYDAYGTTTINTALGVSSVTQTWVNQKYHDPSTCYLQDVFDTSELTTVARSGHIAEAHLKNVDKAAILCFLLTDADQQTLGFNKNLVGKFIGVQKQFCRNWLPKPRFYQGNVKTVVQTRDSIVYLNVPYQVNHTDTVYIDRPYAVYQQQPQQQQYYNDYYQPSYCGCGSGYFTWGWNYCCNGDYSYNHGCYSCGEYQHTSYTGGQPITYNYYSDDDITINYNSTTTTIIDDHSIHIDDHHVDDHHTENPPVVNVTPDSTVTPEAPPVVHVTPDSVHVSDPGSGTNGTGSNNDPGSGINAHPDSTTGATNPPGSNTNGTGSNNDPNSGISGKTDETGKKAPLTNAADVLATKEVKKAEVGKKTFAERRAEKKAERLEAKNVEAQKQIASQGVSEKTLAKAEKKVSAQNKVPTQGFTATTTENHNSPKDKGGFTITTVEDHGLVAHNGSNSNNQNERVVNTKVNTINKPANVNGTVQQTDVKPIGYNNTQQPRTDVKTVGSTNILPIGARTGTTSSESRNFNDKPLARTPDGNNQNRVSVDREVKPTFQRADNQQVNQRNQEPVRRIEQQRNVNPQQQNVRVEPRVNSIQRIETPHENVPQRNINVQRSAPPVAQQQRNVVKRQ
jgi:hypothetical protein